MGDLIDMRERFGHIQDYVKDARRRKAIRNLIGYAQELTWDSERKKDETPKTLD